MAAGGAVIQSAQADQQAEYQSNVLNRNARVAQAQAYLDESAQRRQGRQELGVINAQFSEAGGGMGGTAADVARQSAVNAELDALNIRYGGELRGQGLMEQASDARRQGKARSTALAFQAGSSLLSGYGAYQLGQYESLTPVDAQWASKYRL